MLGRLIFFDLGKAAEQLESRFAGYTSVKIEKGERIMKFGQIIGFAGEDIEPGRHVHTHNCLYAEFDRDYAFSQGAKEEAILPVEQRATFEGFKRANGKVGTRNYLAILTSVNCSATAARRSRSIWKKRSCPCR